MSLGIIHGVPQAHKINSLFDRRFRGSPIDYGINTDIEKAGDARKVVLATFARFEILAASVVDLERIRVFTQPDTPPRLERMATLHCEHSCSADMVQCQTWSFGGAGRHSAMDSYGPAEFVPLEELGVGYWSWQTSPARVRYTGAVADLFNVPIELGSRGLPFECFARAVHPEDRKRFLRLVENTRTAGGSFIAEYRTVSSSGDLRFALDRGVFELGPHGTVDRAHGIVINLTRLGSSTDLADLTFSQPGLPGLSRMEQAAEHAMKLYKLIDVVPGGRGEFAKAALSQVLQIVGQEIVSTLGDTGFSSSQADSTLN